MKLIPASVVGLASFITGSSATAPTTPIQFMQQYGQNCGLTPAGSNGDRIINGDDADIKNHPWQVYISFNSSGNGSSFCGGTIISPHWIITAAHCISKRSMFVYSGTSYQWPLHKKVVGYSVHEMIVKVKHKLYGTTRDNENDIALGKIKGTFQFSESRQPACLPKANFCLNDGTFVSVSGFGAIKTSGFGSSPILQVTDVPIQSKWKCDQSNYAKRGMPVSYRTSFCAGQYTSDSCSGDSGGPVMFKDDNTVNKNIYTVVGAVSWGIGCNRDGNPGVYAMVSKYTHWIAQVSGVYMADQDYSINPSVCHMNIDRNDRMNVNSENAPIKSETPPVPVEPQEPPKSETPAVPEEPQEPPTPATTKSTTTEPVVIESKNPLFTEAVFREKYVMNPFPKAMFFFPGMCPWFGSSTQFVHPSRINLVYSNGNPACMRWSQVPDNSVDTVNPKRPVVTYDWKTMMIKFSRESGKSLCLSISSAKMARKRVKFFRKKGNKSKSLANLVNCDENDTKQRWVVLKTNGRIVQAHYHKSCLQVNMIKHGKQRKKLVGVGNYSPNCKPASFPWKWNVDNFD